MYTQPDVYSEHAAKFETPAVKAAARRLETLLHLNRLRTATLDYAAGRLEPPAPPARPLFPRRVTPRADGRVYGRRPALRLVADRREPGGRRDTAERAGAERAGAERDWWA